MGNVFISHRGGDIPQAEQLATEVQNAGHNVWLDEWEIEIGDSIVEKMNSGLSGSTYLIMCMSKDGVETQWMGREWYSTLAAQMNGHNVKLLPAILTGGEPPALIRDLKYANLAKDWNSELVKLLAAIR